MLNSTRTIKDRGITRLFQDSGNIERPPKTGRGKPFAGKTRARMPGKSGVTRVGDGSSVDLEIEHMGIDSQMSTLLSIERHAALLVSIVLSGKI